MVGEKDSGRGFVLPKSVLGELDGMREAALKWQGPTSREAGNHPAALNLLGGFQKQKADQDEQAAKIHAALADIARLRNSASPEQMDRLDASERDLQVALRELQAGMPSSFVRSKIDNAVANVAQTSSAVTASIGGGGSGSSNTGMAARFYDTARVQAMHQELYNSDTAYGREYRRVTNEIRERADARIEVSQERDRQTKDMLGRHGIKTEHDDDVEEAKKKLDALRAEGKTGPEFHKADVTWNAARMNQIDSAIAEAEKQGKPAEFVNQLKREKATRATELDKAVKDYDAQAKALVEAKTKALSADGLDKNDEEEVKKLRESLEKDKIKALKGGDVKEIKEAASANNREATKADVAGAKQVAALSQEGGAAFDENMVDMPTQTASAEAMAKNPKADAVSSGQKLQVAEADNEAKSPSKVPAQTAAAEQKPAGPATPKPSSTSRA